MKRDTIQKYAQTLSVVAGCCLDFKHFQLAPLWIGKAKQYKSKWKEPGQYPSQRYVPGE